MSVRPPLLAWVQPSSGVEGEDLPDTLGEAGFDVLKLSPGSPLPEGCALRVIAPSAFPSLREVEAELERDPCPTLLLADDDAGDRQADELIARRPQDDLALRQDGAASLARRLHRLLARAIAAGPDLRTRDPLTGLMSRPAFEQSAEPLLAELTPDQPAALIVLDLDHFAEINGLHGRGPADDVLAEVAQRLVRAAMPGDLIGRLGGDAFVLLARRDQRELLWMLAELAREAIAASPCRVDTGRLDIEASASAGMTYLSPGVSLTEAFADAERALAAAKAAGRQRTLTHSSSRRSADSLVADDEARTKVVSARAAQLIAQAGSRLSDATRHRADEDPLTGVWNRGYFNRRLQREFVLARRDHRPLSVALIDLDHFRPFNDNHGQPIGDVVLRRVAELAQACVRSVDWIARFSGEVFAVVTPGDTREAAAVAERIRDEIARANIPTLSGEAVQITVSVGVAAFDESIEQPTELVERALEALQRAKSTGRNRVSLHATAAA